MQEILVFGQDSVSKLLRMKECIDVIEGMYRDSWDEIQKQQARTITVIDNDSVILTMPGLSNKLKRFAVKIVTEFKRNPTLYNLPVQGGIIILINADNSSILALIDSPTLTAIRTGAVSGVATKLLAREDSSVVTVIGSGKQARTQLEAVCAVRRISEVRVYSRRYENAKAFSEEMSNKLNININAYEDRKKALNGADIIITATNSQTPVLDYYDVRSGTHINSIGTLPDRRELGSELLSRSLLFVDNRDGVLREAGDFIYAIKEGKITKDSIIADLSELILSLKPGRMSKEDITVFKSVGFALLDVFACNYLYEKAMRSSERFKEFGISSLKI